MGRITWILGYQKEIPRPTLTFVYSTQTGQAGLIQCIYTLHHAGQGLTKTVLQRLFIYNHFWLCLTYFQTSGRISDLNTTYP